MGLQLGLSLLQPQIIHRARHVGGGGGRDGWDFPDEWGVVRELSSEAWALEAGRGRGR